MKVVEFLFTGLLATVSKQLSLIFSERIMSVVWTGSRIFLISAPQTFFQGYMEDEILKK